MEYKENNCSNNNGNDVDEMAHERARANETSKTRGSFRIELFA